MRFFKYLLFLLISFFSLNVSAEDVFLWYSNSQGTGQGYATQSLACTNLFPGYPHALNASGNTYQCWTSAHTRQGGKVYKVKAVFKCEPAGYPMMLSFGKSDPVPMRRCQANPDGTYCVYEARNPIPLNMGPDRFQQILNSVSETPSNLCTNKDIPRQCDPDDPYGGCYKPDDSQCNRLADGSIYCPPDAPEPDVSKGCANGATYCDRPPTGCGDKYVSGTLNGKQICVKKTEPNTDPEPPVDPENPDPPDPENPDPPQEVDLSAVIAAINAVTAAVNKVTAAVQKMTQEVVYAINIVASKIDLTNIKLDEVKTKIDKTNSELDEANANLADLNDKAATANDLLNDQNSKTDTSNDLLTQIKDAVNAIKDNQGTGDGGSDNGSGSGTGDGGSDKDCVSQGEYDDMSEASAAQVPTSKICKGEYHKTLDSINKNTKDIKDILSGESDGEAPEEHAVPMKELEQSSFVTDIIKVNAAYCPADKVINWQTPFGLFNKTISYQNLCNSSAWLGYLFMIAAYLWAAHIVVRDS